MTAAERHTLPLEIADTLMEIPTHMETMPITTDPVKRDLGLTVGIDQVVLTMPDPVVLNLLHIREKTTEVVALIIIKGPQ
jgi:hypothetical protein